MSSLPLSAPISAGQRRLDLLPLLSAIGKGYPLSITLVSDNRGSNSQDKATAEFLAAVEKEHRELIAGLLKKFDVLSTLKDRLGRMEHAQKQMTLHAQGPELLQQRKEGPFGNTCLTSWIFQLSMALEICCPSSTAANTTFSIVSYKRGLSPGHYTQRQYKFALFASIMLGVKLWRQ